MNDKTSNFKIHPRSIFAIMAIVNHSKKFIFVHVPKTAGTSLVSYLSKFTRDGDLEMSNSSKGRARYEQLRSVTGITKHSTANQIKKFVTPRRWETYFKFAVIRNPYHRAYSSYVFLKENFRDWEGSEVMDTFKSFEKFVESDFFQQPGPDNIFRPQSFWVNTHEELSETELNYIGRLEYLNQTFRALRDKFQDYSFQELVKHNVSTSHSKRKESLNSSEVREIIYERYKIDFDSFKYEK